MAAELIWVAVVAHELRAPLTTMLLWERVLRDPTVGPERHAQALQAIRESAAAQYRIVEDLVLLSRSASGRLHFEPRRVDLGAIVRSAVASASLTGAPRRITVTAELDTPLCAVRGDAQRLRQIIDNVLANALKFCSEGGTITVTVRSADDRARVVIRDDGAGIAAELLPSIFEPFAGQPGSLGLGLAIARELALLHDGSLEAYSDGPGRGATFTFEVPLVTPYDMRSDDREPEPVRLDGLRLLIVDDDPRVRDALAILLERAGAASVTAVPAADARAALDRVQPDVVVCDPTLRGTVTTAVPTIALPRPVDLDVLISAIRSAAANPD